MPLDAQQNAKIADLKKQLEGLAGGPLDASPELLIQLSFPVGAQTYDDNGAVTFRRIILGGKFCSDLRLLDADGAATTGADGKTTFLLSSFLCATVNAFGAPVNLVATPRSATPCYTTTSYDLVPDPNAPGSFRDLQVTLYAWGPDGKPAPNIAIDWRCRLVSYPIIG
jgi:hypothetical protein